MQRSRASSARSGRRARRDGGQRAPPGRPPAPSAAACRPSARARRRPGCAPPALAPEPAVQAAPGRQHERDAARREAGAVQLRGPAAHVLRLHLAQRDARRRAAKLLQPFERLAVQRERARGEPALDPQVLQWRAMSSSSGAARPSARSTRPQRSGGRQQPRQRGAGDLADARQELGAHVGGVARRIGRARAPAGRRPAALSARAAGSSRSTCRRRVVQPADRLEAGVDAAVRRGQAGGEALARRR